MSSQSSLKRQEAHPGTVRVVEEGWEIVLVEALLRRISGCKMPFAFLFVILRGSLLVIEFFPKSFAMVCIFS